MKRLTALIVSAAVTVVLVATVLVVAQARAQTGPSETTAPIAAPIVAPAASDDTAALQQELNDAYTLMQQREAEYQQRLQEAYAQLQAPGQPQGSGEHEDREHEEHESREHESGGFFNFEDDD